MTVKNSRRPAIIMKEYHHLRGEGIKAQEWEGPKALKAGPTFPSVEMEAVKDVKRSKLKRQPKKVVMKARIA